MKSSTDKIFSLDEIFNIISDYFFSEESKRQGWIDKLDSEMEKETKDSYRYNEKRREADRYFLEILQNRLDRKHLHKLIWKAYEEK